MALAGVGLTSCRRPELHLVPFTKNVEWTIPGKFLYYATAMPRRNGAIPLSPRQSTGVRLSSMAIRCIRLVVGRPTLSLRRRFSIFTIRPDRDVLS